MKADAGPNASSVSVGRCTPWTEPPAGKEASPTPAEEEEFTRVHAPPNKDVCAVADSNISRVEAAILDGRAKGLANAPHAPWDKKSRPSHLDKVNARLALTSAERELLSKNGFVVLPRETYSTYAWALHEIYQSELPIYVSVDAILHAVYTSNDHLIADVEDEALDPILSRVLSAMHCSLVDATKAGEYPPEIAHDLDLYLTVARSLLADTPVPSVLGVDDEARRLVGAAKAASGITTLELFGRERVIDWSQYTPRGHYGPSTASDESGEPGPDLAPYFRAAMWLSRLEWNLVSRSSRSSTQGAADPRETPREAIDALALADLVERASMVDDLGKVDRAWALLSGKREDISVSDLLALRKRAGIGSIRNDAATFEKLKSAIGNGYQRTARIHPMAEGASVLPAISTLLGPRIVADTAAFRPLVHTEVQDRYLLHAGDVGYVLGLDSAQRYLVDDLAKFPTLGKKLIEARGTVSMWKDSGDLYGAWLSAIRGIAAKPEGIVPTFMTTPAYDDLRMSSIVAGYGQLRHNYVLMAAQSYDEGGCDIPDGWVEPAVATYDALAAYARRGAAVTKELATLRPRSQSLKSTVTYFDELEKVARVLATISRHELEGRALSADELAFLSMVVEMTPGSTGGPPTYTGWYFDMFRGRWREALTAASFVADIHTSTSAGKVVYAGATAPRLGVFVVDAGGPPRVVVGPVARGYETESTLEKRLNDQTASEAPKVDPWAASYTVPAPPTPAFALTANMLWDAPVVLVIRGGPTAINKMTIELLDHHRGAISSVTRAIPKNGRVVVRLHTKNVEGVRVRVGEYTTEEHSHGPAPDVYISRGGVEQGEGDSAVR